MEYKAFISYSHAADGRLAPSLQSALHRFARPWYRLRSMRVFRDKTSLSATPSLWPSIEHALNASEYFLLLANPEAAASTWVQQEVSWWLESRSAGNLLIILTDGEITWDQTTQDFDWDATTALPNNLRNQFKSEPLYVDLRNAKHRDQLSLRHSEFRGAVLDVASTLLEQPKDQLDGEDIRQHRRTRIISFMAVAIITVLALIAVFQRQIALKERDSAREFLSQVHVTNGLNLTKDNSNFWGGLAWFAETLKWDKDNPLRNHEHRVRLGTYLRHAPKLIQVLRHDHPVNYVAFSPDGQQIVTAVGTPYNKSAKFGEAYVWDVAKGIRIHSPFQHEDAVLSASFSPDGSMIISGSDDGRAHVWDTQKGTLVYSPLENKGTVRRAHFTPDGARIITTGSYTRIWEAATGIPITEPLKVSHCSAWDADLSPDGKLVAVAPASPYSDWGCAPMLWNIESGETVVSEQKGGQWHYATVFSPNSRNVASGGSAGFAWVWNAKTGKTIGELMRHDDRVSSVIYSPAGNHILTASWDGTARLWSSNDGSPVLQGETGKTPIVLKHGSKLLKAVYSPDGLRIVTLGADGTARIWDARSGHSLGPSLPYSVSIYRPETTEVIGTRPGEEASLAFSPEGRRIAIAGWDGIVRIWDLENEEMKYGPFKPGLRRQIQIPSQYSSSWISQYGPKAMSIHPDGKTVTVKGSPWSIEAGLPLKPMKTPIPPDPDMEIDKIVLFDKKTDRRLSVSRDGLLALKTHKGKARIWNQQTKQPVTKLLQHQQTIVAGAFNSDGKWVATADIGGVSRVWQVNTGQPLTPPLRSSTEVEKVSFSPDSSHLYAFCADGSAWVWNLLPESGDLHSLIQLTQYLSTSRLDNTGALVDQKIESFRDDWQQIKNAYPEVFEPTKLHKTAWHRSAAAVSESLSNWPGALLHLNWLTERSPKEWPLYLRRGYVYEKLDKPESAIADYTQAIDLGARDWLAWYGRAQAHMQLDQWEKAAADYIKMIEYGAPNELALGDALLLNAIFGNRNTYDSLVNKITDSQQNKYITHIQVATWALRSGMVGDMGKTLAMAIDWYGLDAIELAPLYYRAGRFKEALQIQKKHLDNYTECDIQWHKVFMAMSLYELGFEKEAEKILSKVRLWLKERSMYSSCNTWREMLPFRKVYYEATNKIVGSRGK